MSIQDFSNINLEKKMLNIMLNDRKAISKVLEKFDIKYITNPLSRWLYKKIVNYFINYSEIPSKTELKEFLRDDFLNDEEKLQTHRVFIRAILELKIDSKIEFIIDQLINIYITANLFDTIKSSVDNTNVGNVREQIIKLQDDLDKMGSVVKLKDVFRYEMNSEFDKLLMSNKFCSDIPTGIPTGYVGMDDVTKGWRPSEITVFSAPAGIGKSTMLLNVAENVNKMGFNVLYFTIELSYVQMKQRRLALVTRLPSNMMWELDTLSPSDEKLFFFRLLKFRIDQNKRKEFVEWAKTRFDNFNKEAITIEAKEKFGFNYGKFVLIDIPFGISVPRLERLITEISRTIKVNLVVIDHVNLVEPSQRSHAHWQNLMETARELKIMSRRVALPIITACQLGVTNGADGKPVELTAGSEKYSKAISENADFMMAWRPSKKDKEMNRIAIVNTKHRHTEGKDFELRVVPSIGLITEYNSPEKALNHSVNQAIPTTVRINDDEQKTV